MSDSLREPWLRGLAFNPAAPSDVLIRLLDPAAGDAGPLMCEDRDLPAAVIDAALRHPSGVIRGALARNRYVDPVRLAPLASDPSGLVRARLASGPRHWPRRVRPLPNQILVTLLLAQDGGEDNRLTAKEIIAELESSRQIPLSFFRSVADHAQPELRTVATWRWESLTPAAAGGAARRSGRLRPGNGAGQELGAGAGTGRGQTAVLRPAQRIRVRHVCSVPRARRTVFRGRHGAPHGPEPPHPGLRPRPARAPPRRGGPRVGRRPARRGTGPGGGVEVGPGRVRADVRAPPPLLPHLGGVQGDRPGHRARS